MSAPPNSFEGAWFQFQSRPFKPATKAAFAADGHPFLASSLANLD